MYKVRGYQRAPVYACYIIVYHLHDVWASKENKQASCAFYEVWWGFC